MNTPETQPVLIGNGGQLIECQHCRKVYKRVKGMGEFCPLCGGCDKNVPPGRGERCNVCRDIFGIPNGESGMCARLALPYRIDMKTRASLDLAMQPCRTQASHFIVRIENTIFPLEVASMYVLDTQAIKLNLNHMRTLDGRSVAERISAWNVAGDKRVMSADIYDEDMRPSFSIIWSGVRPLSFGPRELSYGRNSVPLGIICVLTYDSVIVRDRHEFTATVKCDGDDFISNADIPAAATS